MDTARPASPDAVAIVGVGGIGASVAAALALAGDEVVVVDRAAEHVDAIRKRGLRVDGHMGDHTVRLDHVFLPSEWVGQARLVLVAVRSSDTDSAVDVLLPHLTDDSVVVSLQNGWNANVIASRIGRSRTLPAMVHMPARYNGPGYVTRLARGDFYLGEIDGQASERVKTIAARLSHGVPTHPSDNVWGYIWSKQVYATIMPANALVDLPVSEIVCHDWVKLILVALIAEAMQAADAAGVALEPYDRFDPAAMRMKSAADLPTAIAELPSSSVLGNTGFWRALKEGRPTEVEHLSGHLARIGQRHGLAMTLNERVAEMVLEIERGQRTMDWANLRALEEPARRFLDALLGSAA